MVDLLAPLHGLYNVAVAALVFFQALLGLKIRRARRTGAAFPVSAVKRHRKIGPFLPWLAALGFAAGLFLILLDRRRLLAFPDHFFLGLSIVLLLFFQRRLGLRILGRDSVYRNPHFLLGLVILAVYVAQISIGLRLLL
jgi:hypothetical protein